MIRLTFSEQTRLAGAMIWVPAKEQLDKADAAYRQSRAAIAVGDQLGHRRRLGECKTLLIRTVGRKLGTAIFDDVVSHGDGVFASLGRIWP